MASEKTTDKLTKLIRWSKITAKFTAIGAAIAGAVAALTSSSSTTSLAVGAAGATSYAAAKAIPVQGYEKTKHVRPVKTSSASQAILNHQPVKVSKVAAKPAEPVKEGLPSLKTTTASAVAVKQYVPQYISRQPVMVVDEEEALPKKKYS